MNAKEMRCKSCKIVYDVEELPQDTWRVKANDPRMVDHGQELFLPMDYQDCDQLQAFGTPSCLDPNCLGELK